MKTYTRKNARFTVITEGALRIEYADNAAFVNEPTLFAVRQGSIDASAIINEDTLTLKTDKFTLTYKGFEPFSKDNLSVHIHTCGTDTVWHYGDALKNNLGGTLVTLDGVNGRKPLPNGIISRDGFYIVDDGNKPILRNGWIANRNKDHKTDLYLFAYGNDYKGAIKDLSCVSGKFQLPRRCVFGSWYSRWWRYTSEEFLSLVDEYDANDFPLDIMVMDMDWHYQDWGHAEGEPFALFGYGHCGENLGWTGYTWNRTAIPDPDGLLSQLNSRGIKVVLNDHPADGIRDHDEHYPEFIKELEEHNYTEEVPDIPERISAREKENNKRNIKNFRFNAGSSVYMDAFFNNALAPIERSGVEFWWLDWQQDYLYPTVNGINDLPHLSWLNHLYYEHSKKDGKRGASFSRWGGIGDHKHPAYFSGDAVSSWETLAFEVEMTASAANAGCFFWSHDIGGFVDPIPGGQAENYVRWVQFGALSASLRLHMNGVEGFDRRPWTWGEPYCSAMREAFHLRSRMFPYIYSSAYNCCKKAIPFIRPLYYEAPDIKDAYLHPTTYFIGNDLIVSPICQPMNEEGKALSALWLPDGAWYNIFTGKSYEGGNIKTEDGLFTFPLFIRANTPLVTQPYRDRMASSPMTELCIDIYCNGYGRGSFSLFEDDGESELSKDNNCRITKIEYAANKDKYEIKLTPEGCFDNAPKTRTLRINLHNVKKLSCAEGLKVCYNEAEQKATVTIENTDADLPVCITLA